MLSSNVPRILVWPVKLLRSKVQIIMQRANLQVTIHPEDVAENNVEVSMQEGRTMVQTIRPGIYMVQDDLNPPVDFQISNDDAVIDPITGDVITPATAYDLTGCTVKFT